MAEDDHSAGPEEDPEPTPGRIGKGAWSDGVGGDGLRWSFDADLEAALAEIGRSLDGSAWEDQEAILAAESEAADRGDPSVDLTGLVAEHLPAGPGLAAWLAQQDAAQLADRDLPGAAAAYRRIASWAQAAELSAVAEIAARSAARDQNAELAADGCPDQVTRDAAAQVGLGLALSPYGAAAWASLAVTLRWRLFRTGAALAEGTIDLYRARVIAEATTPLTDEAARQVEDRVLPRAGDLTYGQLHSAVRRAVIAADPEGAEHRRQAAERRARVSLYPDEDHTATLAGTTLPAVHAAAAMARVSAMARALKASGAAGGTDYLRAHVFLGLLTGTLPLIPPPAGAPPDSDPPPGDDDVPGDDPAEDDLCGGGRTGDAGPDSDRPAGGAPPRGGPHNGPGHGGDPGHGSSSPGGSCRDRRAGRSPHNNNSHNSNPESDRRPRGRPAEARPPGDSPPGDSPPNGSTSGRTHGTDPPDAGRGGNESWPTPPPPLLTDADAPQDDGFRDSPPPPPDGYDDDVGYHEDPLDDHFALRGVVPALPVIPTVIPALPGEASQANKAGAAGRPPAGLLDLSLPWATLICESSSPGTLGRIGPITASQARRLARLAATHHGTQWRVVLTDDRDHVIAVSRVQRGQPPIEQCQPGYVGLLGRVTVTMPAASLDRDLPDDTETGEPLHEILRAAALARARAAHLAQADLRAPDGCAHTEAAAAYRPPPRIREYVAARDLTCRYPYCGQPAWRGDLDHTRAWHKGGRTCRCNLGPLCRAHHILKQLAGWQLTQPQPGIFHWTTPAGRTYIVGPDFHQR